MAYLRVLSALIASASTVFNLLVCLMFLRKRTLLKKPYCVFLLNLAITDMTTGLLMFLTPGLIFSNPVTIPNSYFFGVIYCRVFWSRWLLFALGAVSVYTSLVLTVERWTAVCRPFNYKARFSSWWLAWYIILIWIVGIALSLVATIKIVYHSPSSNITTPRCSTEPSTDNHLEPFISTLAVTLKFFVPSLAVMILYAVAVVKMQRSSQFFMRNHKGKSIKSITKMALTASMALIICWSPNQIYFVLHKFNHAKVFNVFHNISTLVVFLNSCINPFIYALWGRQFRRVFKSLLLSPLCCSRESPDGVGLRLDNIQQDVANVEARESSVPGSSVGISQA